MRLVHEVSGKNNLFCPSDRVDGRIARNTSTRLDARAWRSPACEGSTWMVRKRVQEMAPGCAAGMVSPAQRNSPNGHSAVRIYTELRFSHASITFGSRSAVWRSLDDCRKKRCRVALRQRSRSKGVPRLSEFPPISLRCTSRRPSESGPIRIEARSQNTKAGACLHTGGRTAFCRYRPKQPCG